MSVREEDRKKNSCSSRGLGVAAAAIGVGVGAALYYYFSKRDENPHGEGSTSGWNSSQEQALHQDSDSYTTVSEHSTTDTSVHDSTMNESGNDSDNSIIYIDSDDSCSDVNSDSQSEDNVTQSDSDRMSTSSDENYDSMSDFETGMNESIDFITDESLEQHIYESHISNAMIHSDSDSEGENEWDVTNVSTDIPSELRPNRLLQFIDSLSNVISPSVTIRTKRRRDQEERDFNRAKAFRERSWSLEECSICFDVILKDQKVTTLSCTHHFHSACIEPWLNEQQTCPNCRKQAQ